MELAEHTPGQIRRADDPVHSAGRDFTARMKVHSPADGRMVAHA